jgi:hypothetical protein
MRLSDNEVFIFKEALRQIKKLELIKLVLNADFSPEVSTDELTDDGKSGRKDLLNAYRREGVLYAMLIPYAKLFFTGRLETLFARHGVEKSVTELVEFLTDQLNELWFGMNVLEGINKGGKKATKNIERKS